MAEKIRLMNEMIAKLAKSQFLLLENMEIAIESSANKVSDTVKSKFGHYQPGIGGLPAWQQLAESTIKQKERAGGGEDPLIGYYPEGKKRRKVKEKSNSKGSSAKLKDSIKVKRSGLIAFVGTDDPIAKYHEFGTSHIPPRPFLRPALQQEQGFIQTEFRKAILKTMKEI